MQIIWEKKNHYKLAYKQKEKLRENKLRRLQKRVKRSRDKMKFSRNKMKNLRKILNKLP